MLGLLKAESLTSHESYETISLCFVDILRGMSTYEMKLTGTHNRRNINLCHAPTHYPTGIFEQMTSTML